MRCLQKETITKWNLIPAYRFVSYIINFALNLQCKSIGEWNVNLLLVARSNYCLEYSFPSYRNLGRFSDKINKYVELFFFFFCKLDTFFRFKSIECEKIAQNFYIHAIRVWIGKKARVKIKSYVTKEDKAVACVMCMQWKLKCKHW